MSYSFCTFHLIASSTSSDLKVKRNALQQYVFPRLCKLAISYNCWFQSIDLRWAVSQKRKRHQLGE